MKIVELFKEFVTKLEASAEGVEPQAVETAELKLEDAQVIALAAGVEADVEIARSGKFVDMNKNVVEVTPDLMKALAASVDLEAHEPKLKLGHEPIKTDTPDFGSVLGLRYDDTIDRLMAKIRPTQALIKRVREGAFNSRSMEFSRDEKGGVKFLHLGFLGARRPAISGLTPVALSEPVAGEPTVLCTEPEDAAEFFAFGLTAAQRDAVAAEDFAGPNRTFPINSQAHVEAAASLLHHAADPSAVKAKIIAIAKRKGFSLPATWSTSKPIDKAASSKGEQKVAASTPDEETQNMAQEATIERLRAQIKDGARDRVKAFLAANVKRIPLGVVKAGVEDGLVALMTAETDSDATFSFKLSEGAERATTASEFVFAILAAFPEQITAAETTETAKAGAEEAVLPAEFADADPASVDVHFAAEREMAEAKAAGSEISYLEGVLRVERKARASSKK
jgi:hypothetical protein